MAESDTTTEQCPSTYFKEEWDTENLFPEDAYTDGKFVKEWYNLPKGVNAEYPYEFCCQRLYTQSEEDSRNGKVWESWKVGNIALWAHYAEDASFYTLTLDNLSDFVFYSEKKLTEKEDITISPRGCTTSYIRLIKGTKTLDPLTIDELKIGNEDFIDSDGNLISEKSIELALQQWKVSIVVEKDPEEGLYATIMKGSFTPILDAADGNINNSTVRIPITATNHSEGITKTVMWTISALWDRYVHRYRLILTPDCYNTFQSVTCNTDNSIARKDATTNVTEILAQVYLDEENNSWHSIVESYPYIIQIESTDGSSVRTLEGKASGITTIPLDTLNALRDLTNYNPLNSRGSAGGKTFIFKLFVKDPDYKNSDKAPSIYPGYYKVDLACCNINYTVVEILLGLKGDTGATGTAGALGAQGASGTIVSVVDEDSYISLTIDGKTYNLQKVTSE